MTYDEQLQKLRDKNLQIRDEAAARDALRRIGYFSLITGYKDLFKNPTTKNYRDGTDLQDILSLYRFDEQLRELTLRYLLHIEQLIRSEISYAFCALFGEKQEAYLSAQNYCSKSGRCREIEILIQKHLRPLLDQRTDYPYIEHCKQRYGNVPLWVLVKALPFGTVSKMYVCAGKTAGPGGDQPGHPMRQRKTAGADAASADSVSKCMCPWRTFVFLPLGKKRHP